MVLQREGLNFTIGRVRAHSLGQSNTLNMFRPKHCPNAKKLAECPRWPHGPIKWAAGLLYIRAKKPFQQSVFPGGFFDTFLLLCHVRLLAFAAAFAFPGAFPFFLQAALQLLCSSARLYLFASCNLLAIFGNSWHVGRLWCKSNMQHLTFLGIFGQRHSWGWNSPISKWSRKPAPKKNVPPRSKQKVSNMYFCGFQQISRLNYARTKIHNFQTVNSSLSPRQRKINTADRGQNDLRFGDMTFFLICVKVSC